VEQRLPSSTSTRVHTVSRRTIRVRTRVLVLGQVSRHSEHWPRQSFRPFRLRSAYAPCVAHYIFNVVKPDAAEGLSPREHAAPFMQVGMWGVHADEPHRNALASGDLILIYLGAPEREFIGRAELASAVHDWTPSEAPVYPGDSPRGVLLAQVEAWDPPVPMETVLAQIDSAEAKADFQAGVVRITASEYETALAVAADARPRLADPTVALFRHPQQSVD
jgi:hypothetical protein